MYTRDNDEKSLPFVIYVQYSVVPLSACAQIQDLSHVSETLIRDFLTFPLNCNHQSHLLNV
jgi:hypothetical protein